MKSNFTYLLIFFKCYLSSFILPKVMLKDQLSWDEFYKKALKENLFQKVKEFNRLVAHSKNFFIIAGYGAFTLDTY